MKRIFISLIAILTFGALTSFAEDCCNAQSKYDYSREYRCSQLINRIKSQRNTLYNVLGLSEKQQELKDEIEYRKNAELEPVYKVFNENKKQLRYLAQTSYGSKEFKKQKKATVKKLHKCKIWIILKQKNI